MKPSRENVQTQQGSSFACLEFDLPHFDHQYHYHPEVEITWILESEGQRLIGDALAPFSAGDFVLIGGNVPHQYRNWRCGRARSRVIQFERGRFGHELFKLPEFGRIDRLLGDAARGISFSESIRASAQKRMTEIFAVAPGPARLLKLLELLQLLSEDPEPAKIASVAYAEPVKVKKIERLQRVLNYLENRWQEPIALRDAAKVAALHPQSMSRFFRQHLGMSFQDYLVQLRVSRAAQRLLETERTVVDIAFECGFNNLANFNRHFQKAYRQTPSAYRKKT